MRCEFKIAPLLSKITINKKNPNPVRYADRIWGRLKCLRHFNLPACGSPRQGKFWIFNVLDCLRLILLASGDTFEVVYMQFRLDKVEFMNT